MPSNIISSSTSPEISPLEAPLATQNIPPEIPPPSAHTMVTRRQAGISKPNPKYAMHVAYNSQPLEPTCYSQIVKHEEWHQAMGDELNALQKNGTWSLLPPHSNFNILPKK